MLRSGASFRRLDRILLTHGHFGHVLGIPSLFSTLRLRQSAETMTIHGGASTLDGGAKLHLGADAEALTWFRRGLKANPNNFVNSVAHFHYAAAFGSSRPVE